MRILGISCNYHDAAACLYGEDGVIAAAEEERFSRRKHDARFPVRAVSWVLEHGGVGPEALDHVVFYEKPIRKFERILAMAVDAFPVGVSHFVPAMRSWLSDKLWVADRIRALGYRGQIMYSQHHLSHAASAFYGSPFDEAAVLTIDGVGERATTTIARGHGLELETIEEIRFPHSLGLLFSVFTAFLGFDVNDGEYKVMGLAAHGRPHYADRIRELLVLGERDAYRVDTRYIAYHRMAANWTDRFVRTFGPPFSRGAVEAGIDERAADIAASIQLVTEEMILRLAKHARQTVGSTRLCVAGGVAQNVLANGRLLRESGFDSVYVPPAPGDSGGALGAAAYVAHAVRGIPRPPVAHSAYLGPAFADAHVRRAIASSGLRYREIGRESVAREAARMIVSRRVIGWFQGRMEFGPRALGARSILADARDPSMKDRVNSSVKHREPFRPFAPAIAIDDASALLGSVPDGRFMSFAVPVPSGAHQRMPAVVHLDGTSRVQIVRPEDHPVFYDLLREVGSITGDAVVLNTSFNLRGEPIVATPEDALECFSRTALDALFIEGFVVEPPEDGRTTGRHVERQSHAASVPVA